MEKLLVINGCSHSVGSEAVRPMIGDGPECRDNCFGAYLASQLGRQPVHLAVPGGSNDWIARTTAAWVGDHIDDLRAGKLDVIFLIHWTGAERWEYRFPETPFFTPFINYHHDIAYKNFTIKQTTIGSYKGFQKKLFTWFERIFAEDPDFWSDNKIKNIIFLQELLKNNNCKYWFGNAFDTYRPTITSNSLLNLLDQTHYPYLTDDSKSYYQYCINNGFERKSDVLMHLGKEAHEFYAKFLRNEFERLNFI